MSYLLGACLDLDLARVVDCFAAAVLSNHPLHIRQLDPTVVLIETNQKRDAINTHDANVHPPQNVRNLEAAIGIIGNRQTPSRDSEARYLLIITAQYNRRMT